MGWKLGMCMERCNVDFTKMKQTISNTPFHNHIHWGSGFRSTWFKGTTNLITLVILKSLFVRSCLLDMGMDMDQNHPPSKNGCFNTNKPTIMRIIHIYHIYIYILIAAYRDCNPMAIQVYLTHKITPTLAPSRANSSKSAFWSLYYSH